MCGQRLLGKVGPSIVAATVAPPRMCAVLSHPKWHLPKGLSALCNKKVFCASVQLRAYYRLPAREIRRGTVNTPRG
jgi:hypothetical protein